MNLKRLAEISPIIFGYLIFLGFFKLHMYYLHWNIRISDYLEFSEIILAFLNDVHILLFFLLLLSTQSFFGNAIVDSIDRKLDRMEKQVVETANQNLPPGQSPKTEGFKGIVPIVLDLFDKYWIIAILFFLSLMLLFLYLFLDTKALGYLYLCVFFFMQLCPPFLEKVVAVTLHNQKVQLSIGLSLLIFSYGMSEYNIYQSVTSLNQTTVYLKGSNLQKPATSKNILFIGKTNQFTFLHNKMTHRSIVIPNERVSAVQISQ